MFTSSHIIYQLKFLEKVSESILFRIYKKIKMSTFCQVFAAVH